MEFEPSPSRGWQVGVSLQDRLHHMLTHEVDCDVTFSFPHAEPPTTIRAHKLVLKAGSPVFEAMFSGNFTETYTDVEIVEIVPTVFKEMLRYLYTDTGNVTAENVLPLIFTAKKYIIDGLTALCTSFLNDFLNELNEENVCKILNDSVEYGVESLAESCCEFISPKTKSIIKTPGFRNMSHEALLLLLRYDGLVIENEILVYEACVAWARSQLAAWPLDQMLRTKLGSCLYEIRFHSMKYDEFANKIGNANDILNGEEKSRIYGYLISKSAATKDKLEFLGFNMNTRPAAVFKIPCYKPDCPVQYGLNGDASETLTFLYTGGPRMLLQGVSIYGGENEGDTHNIILKVVCMDPSGSRIQSDTTKGAITASANTRPVDFELTKPHASEPGKEYILSLNSKGPSAYFKEGQYSEYYAGDMKFVFNVDGERGGGLALCQNQGNNRIAELILSQR